MARILVVDDESSMRFLLRLAFETTGHQVEEAPNGLVEIAVAGTLRPVPQSNSERVVLACPPDEQHDTGLRMVEQLLLAHGYEASMLGAATPISALVDYVRRSRPLAVGLSVASPLAIGSLATAVATLREAEPELPVFVGGRCVEGYPAVAAAVGARRCTSTRDTLTFLDALRLAG